MMADSGFKLIFLLGTLKFKILSSLFTNALLCSKVGIIRNEFYFCGFHMDV